MRISISSVARASVAAALLVLICEAFAADEKSDELTKSRSEGTPRQAAAAPKVVGGTGRRITVGEGDTEYPVVVVRGTPYEMGWHLGGLIRDDMQRLIPAAMGRLVQQAGITEAQLKETWARTAAFSDLRFQQELLGLADGSGMPLPLL